MNIKRVRRGIVLGMVGGLAGLGGVHLWAGQILPEATASRYLQTGALLVDVRSLGEFTNGHAPQAINIPLAEVKSQFPQQVTNKSSVILLYCRTGHRSGLAEQELHDLGYTNAFSIGTLKQAKHAVSMSRANRH